MAKYFKISINDNDDTGVTFNSFVDVPAHLRSFIAFNKEEAVSYTFSEEERLVTGCMIAVDMPIARFSKDIGKHYVLFDSETVKKINLKFSKNNYANNVNKMHNMGDVTKGAVQVARFIVSNSDDKLPNVPQAFENQNIKDGSLFCTYKVEDNKLWEEVKSGKFNGFSVEGLFERNEVQVKTKKIEKMKKQDFWKKAFSIFSIEEESTSNEITFSEATTADGVVVFYDGELVEGATLTIEADGAKIPAPEGEHELTLSDGNVKVVMLDAAGVVQSISDVQVMDEQTEGQALFMKEFVKATNERFEALEKDNQSLRNELESRAKGEKFNKQTKQTGGDKTSWRQLVK